MVVAEPRDTLGATHKEPVPWSNGLKPQRAIPVTVPGSMELIRPLGLALRQQLLLLILRAFQHRRTKRDKVSLKVFLSPQLIARR